MKAKKRLFIGLLSVAFCIILIITAVLWYIITSGYRLSENILSILGILFSIMGFLLAIGLILTSLTLITQRNIGACNGIINSVLRAFLPLAVFLGRFFGIDKDKVRGSFIEVHNQLIHSEEKKVKPEKILLLVPHCIQWSGCPYKITIKPDNCRRCGKCLICEILFLKDEYGINVGVASGGSQARRLVKELKPDAIVAIACERDLTSGIQDVSSLPVLGVVNERPEGPCINTTADLEKIREAIDFFLKIGDS